MSGKQIKVPWSTAQPAAPTAETTTAWTPDHRALGDLPGFDSFEYHGSMAMLAAHTVLPQVPSSYERMGAVLQSEEVYLADADGKTVRLTGDLLRVLAEVVEALHAGTAVSVVPRPTSLTTQEAADLLGVSRPTLVKLLDEGCIDYEKPGRHRRVQLQDLLEYQAGVRMRRNDLLSEMTEEVGKRLTDEPPDTFVHTR